MEVFILHSVVWSILISSARVVTRALHQCRPTRAADTCAVASLACLKSLGSLKMQVNTVVK